MLILDGGKKIRKSLCIFYTAAPSLLFFFSFSAFAARPLTTEDVGQQKRENFS